MKIKQVTIHTSKFEEEIKFYTEECGLKVIRDGRPAKELIFLGDSAGEAMVELIKNENAIEVGNEFFQIAFIAGDVEKKREEMIAKGYEVTDIIQPSPVTKFFFTHDPQGVKIQFNN